MTLNLFPWEKGEKPYFVNPEGFEWHLDKDTNDRLKKDHDNGSKGINDMACFFVRKGDDVTRILIDNNQTIIKESTNWEQMLCYIDILKFNRSYDNSEKLNE